MLLNFISTITTFRTLPGLNKILNETISANYGTTIIETKMSYVIYTQITAIFLLLTGLLLCNVLGLPVMEDGLGLNFYILNNSYEEFIIDYTTLTLSINSIPSAPKNKKNKTEIPSPDKKDISTIFKNVNILNISSLFIICIFIYYGYTVFFKGEGFESFIITLVTLILSFLISSYVLNNYKYSDNFLIKILQWIAIRFALFIFTLSILFYFGNLFDFWPDIECQDDDNTNTDNKNKKHFDVETRANKSGTEDYHLTINKEFADKTINTLGKAIKKGMEEIAPNLGAASAGGYVGAAVFKGSAAMPPIPRLGYTAAATFVGAGSAQAGVNVVKSVYKNTDIINMIKSSPHSNTDIDRIPSPSNEFISSVIEDHTPLEVLLSSQFMLNLFILILLIILFIMIFNRFFLNKNAEFINEIVNKINNKKIKEWINKRIDKSVDYQNKYNIIVFIIIVFIILFSSLLNLIISAILSTQINDYIEVHNYLKDVNKSTLLIISCININTANNINIKNK